MMCVTWQYCCILRSIYLDVYVSVWWYWTETKVPVHHRIADIKAGNYKQTDDGAAFVDGWAAPESTEKQRTHYDKDIYPFID